MTVEKILSSSKGQILIFTALAFIVLGLMVGLAVDAGRAYLVQSRLSKIVDAAAMAGARAMPGGTSAGEATTLATNAACDSAAVNGINPDECGASGSRVFVTVDEVTNPDGTGQLGVIVSAVDAMTTSFMRLGTLIGCGAVCNNITISATGAAAPDSLVDVVLVLDTTASMTFDCDGGEADGGIGVSDPNGDCPIAQLRKGAKALVDCLIGTDCGVTSSNAKIGLVPFRACYNSDSSNGCIDDTEPNSKIVNLTDNNGTLTSGINALTGEGFTNVCTGIRRGREVLFGAGARAIARKAMVVLTDGANHFDTSGNGSSPANCPIAPGDDNTINALDTITNNLVTDIKRGQNVGTSGQNSGQIVEIYVLRFAACDLPPWQSDCGDNLPSPGTCDRSLVGAGGVSSRNERDNDPRDRNLSRCIASNNSNNASGAPDPDPFSTAPNDHYFWAANPAAIQSGLTTIAQELLKKLRLVS
jgi:Flp pilus assembly protein TadG